MRREGVAIDDDDADEGGQEHGGHHLEADEEPAVGHQLHVEVLLVIVDLGPDLS